MTSSETTELMGISLASTSGTGSLRRSATDENSKLMEYNTISTTPAVVSMVPWVTEGIIISTVGTIVILVAIRGLVTNVIVMTVFRRQGIMAESSTVSLFALAMADFTLQLGQIGSVGGKIMSYHVDLDAISFHPAAVYELVPFRIRVTSLHLIAWLTAYLSFERCISVMFPFHVKHIFSPRISVISVTCLFIGTIITYIPSLTAYAFTTVLRYNETYLTIYATTIFSQRFNEIYFYVYFIGLRYSAIFIVVLSNVIILKKVTLSKKWRNPTSSSSSQKNSSEERSEKSKSTAHKEDRLSKQLIIISGIFLVCTLPDTVIHLFTQSSFAILDYSARVVWYVGNMLFESVNSSINICVYYTMSTKFKKEFRKLLGLAQK